jgi:signal transduction histidine kinase
MNKHIVWRNKCSVAIIATLIPFVGYGAVQAQSTTISVQIGPPVIDVCPNILGVQAVLPGGMIINGNGDCVTPAPPVTDVCLNIAGNQETIPVGYYQDGSGNCLPQPTPPVDVCPNLYGVQSIVPSSLIIDAGGNCVAPPLDECPNIDGPQSAVPPGLVKVSDICFTPEPVVPPTSSTTPPTSSSGTPTGPDYKNVPAALDPLVEPLVAAVPESVKKFAQSVSPDISRTIPYYIYGVLAAGALAMLIQALREMFAASAILLLYKREKNIAEQKNNFIALASHYLRTPLTLMRNGLDTIVALKELDPSQLKPIRSALSAMDKDIKEILTDLDNNTALKDINSPPKNDIKQSSALRSWFFWGPVLASLVLTWASNFLLGVVADVDLGTANLLFQVIVIVAASIVFYSALRNLHIRQSQLAYQQKLLDHERIIDDARNEFISRSTNVLQKGLVDIYHTRHLLKDAPSASFFDEGYIRFNNILEKFLLLGSIKANNIKDVERLNLKEIIDGVLSKYDKKIAEKNVTIVNNIDDSIFIEENPALFEFAMSSVIDNAIKFNEDGGTVTIATNRTTKQMSVTISDTGVGIPKDKLAQLFKPFSRAESALQFNYEGLGFSLFLDKIIADYMGGAIMATSAKDKGTNITVRTDIAHAQ